MRAGLFLFIFLAMLEGANRVYEARLSSSTTAPEFESRRRTPYLEFQVESNYHSPDLSTNSDGLRYAEIPVRKAPGTVRVFVLGPSFVFDGDSNETTIPGWLEQMARRAYPRAHIEVINAGSTAYNSTQSALLYFLKLAKYNPDIVIFMGGKVDLYYAETSERRVGYPFNFATQEDHEKAVRRILEMPWPALLLGRYSFLGRINPDLDRRALLQEFASPAADLKPFRTLDEFAPYVNGVTDNCERMMLLNKALGIPGFFFLEPRSRYSELQGQAFDLLYRRLSVAARGFP
ncbi:MAG TPA: SGNH/GDSL hydrolase family protein, partial [Hyphomicrobiales bacterium]|nr:SGNH/GDSL hydrolase family protein [Hyphomicrobiales bacterium]